jgi:hypothetical protein
MARKSLGYVVVTYDEGRRPFAGFLYDSLDRATADRDGMERNSVNAVHPERHVVAEVFEVEEEGGHDR